LLRCAGNDGYGNKKSAGKLPSAFELTAPALLADGGGAL
jgi:hypothetical protein